MRGIHRVVAVAVAAALVAGLPGLPGVAGRGDVLAGAAPQPSTASRSLASLGPLRATAVAAMGHMCAIMEDGTVRCWGDNEFGALGDGTLTSRWTPVAVPGITTAVQVTGTFDATCVRLADTTVRCWGNNEAGELGDGSTTRRLAPVAVEGLADVVSLDGGGFHVCAALSRGTVRCWGANGSGELGDGTLTDRHIPVEVLGLGDAVTVSAGPDHTCALLGDGTVRCWGANESGQLGDGSTHDSPVPVAVVGITDAVAVGAGMDTTCALLRGGTVQCWGNNENGWLGDGPTTSRSVPGPVPGITTAASMSAGDEPSCVRLDDRSVTCWGPLGLEDGRASPVVGIADAADVSSDGNSACVVALDGSARCWGGSGWAVLGFGIDGNSDIPAPVVGIGPAGSDTDQPTAPGRPSVSLRVGAALRGTRVPVSLSWTGSTDATSGLAARPYTVQGWTDAESMPMWGNVATSSSTKVATWAYAGVGWHFRVVARDAVGHAIASPVSPVRTWSLIQQSSRAIRYSGSWWTSASDKYSGGTVRAASRAGASASYTFTGRGIALVTTTARTRGRVRIYIDGTWVPTLDLYRSVVTYRALAWAKTWSSRGTHTIRLVVVGTGGRPRVDLDAFVVVR